MGRIPDEIIQKIRDHVDVVELVGRSVSLKRAGRNYKGLCPFHDEKTPSFNVNPDRQSYYCFGCQEGGDVFSFLMKAENLTFAEAARSLARDCGIEVPETGERRDGGVEALFAANDAALACYRAELAKPGCPGAAYLEDRGIDAAAIERFQIGFAPDAWSTVVDALRAAGVPALAGERAGLLQSRERGGHYDKLRGRVVFPIQDVRGRVIGFGGRAIAAGQEPKYLNTPETPIFHKREALYGLPQALEPIRRAQRVIVVEGYFDQIALCRAGLPETVATCGTALTPEHARNLRRRTQHVVLLFDGDEAGVRAMVRALEVLLPSGLRVHAAMLPSGDDPDTLLAREGAEALRKLVQQAPAALDVAIERAVAKGHATPWEKADAVAEVAPLIARVGSAIERAEYCTRLALAVGTEPRHVEQAVAAAARGEDASEAVPVAPRRSGPEERKLRELARCLVEFPAVAAELPAAELRELIGGGALAELIHALVDAAGEDHAVDLEMLAARLSDEARTLLRALSVEDAQLDAAIAARVAQDTLDGLRAQELRARQQEITRKLRTAGAEERERLIQEQSLLLERKRRFTERRLADPTPMGPPA